MLERRGHELPVPCSLADASNAIPAPLELLVADSHTRRSPEGDVHPGLTHWLRFIRDRQRHTHIATAAARKTLWWRRQLRMRMIDAAHPV